MFFRNNTINQKSSQRLNHHPETPPGQTHVSSAYAAEDDLAGHQREEKSLVLTRMDQCRGISGLGGRKGLVDGWGNTLIEEGVGVM